MKASDEFVIYYEFSILISNVPMYIYIGEISFQYLKLPPFLFLFSVMDYYPKTNNPFGSDEEQEEKSEKPVPLLRKNKSMSMSLSNLNSNTLRNKSMSLISINSTISGSTNTLERQRRRSRKSYRAPEPPKGIRPFSLILEASEKSA